MADAISTQSEWRRFQRCEMLGHPDAIVGYFVAQSGARHLCWWCETCDRNVTHPKTSRRKTYLTPADLPDGIVLEKLPVFRTIERVAECYWCQQPALCEWHHIGPKELYGKDADRLPVVPLCRPCHQSVTELTRAAIARLRRGVA